MTSTSIHRKQIRNIAAMAIITIHAALAVVLANRSNGTYMDDELRHYLVARTSRLGVRYLLDVWGRPGFTVLFAPAANLSDIVGGFAMTRLMTALIAVLAGVLTWRTAKLMRAPVAWLAPGLLLLMPLWLGLSYTPTTEMAAALYAIGGTWQLAKGNRNGAAAWFALFPLTRHEMIVLLVPIAIYFLYRRAWAAVFLLGWAELAWICG